MEIKVQSLEENEIEALEIRNWPVWTKEVSTFDWFYDTTEKCYFLEGRVIIQTEKGEIEIKKGDFVTFPVGLKCIWKILEPVRKHYKFE
ncbi:MAG: cupin domain-containing protein [Candidatus Kapaibacteriales bacterium]